MWKAQQFISATSKVTEKALQQAIVEFADEWYIIVAFTYKDKELSAAVAAVLGEEKLNVPGEDE